MSGKLPLSTPPQITLEAATVRREGNRILENLTLTAQERRIAIVGRNGSGKTTLARVLAGLQPCDDGRALVNGTDLARDRKAALRTVGIIFQNPDHQIIFPTVEEEIGFGLQQLGQDKSTVAENTAEILSRFGKTAWAKMPTHSLSQGQKQLVCLMAVLAMNPAVILLDEPYSGLDIPTRMQLMRYVDQVDATVIQITHDPATVRHFDRVIWLDDGKLRLDGPADAVLDAFETQMITWGEADDLADLTR
ncbi:energy-coupling factor ABC transporter ATP-binding protein [Donghicola sp. XS_ASV15]|uniref:energy-coupling factor ABC transporter ATP-binding protein n=1 Tax=Donghicola sp. XS_ASV15 TaxID=3241295 RepID=UPI0035147500